MKQTKRTRNFVAIGYPESLCENWLEKLADTHIQIVISPLHDKDKNPDGETKKAHYHIMLMYESPHTQEQAQEIFDSVGCTRCEMVNSTRGQARYMCHLDNLEKEQYPTSDVRCLNGVDYTSLIELPSDNREALREMIQFIQDQDIRYFETLVTYAAQYNESWFRALSEHSTLFISEFIKSYAYRKKNEMWSIPTDPDNRK